jgi:hypothetical protein
VSAELTADCLVETSADLLEEMMVVMKVASMELKKVEWRVVAMVET